MGAPSSRALSHSLKYALRWPNTVLALPRIHMVPRRLGPVLAAGFTRPLRAARAPGVTPRWASASTAQYLCAITAQMSAVRPSRLAALTCAQCMER